MDETNFSSIEQKWQKEWEEKSTFSVSNNSKKKFYVLEMFPYPSGAGLHMGHALNYTIGDIQARFRRMSGCSVLYPMGYDAFGLPAENAAIKAGEHPSDYTKKSIANFINQQKALGLSYDWERLVVTSVPEYYKWNQYFFLKFFEKGLVQKKKAAVNWCPDCNTVLANEQVHNGKCWRHADTDVVLKQLEQWFIKTTDYADELLEKTDELEWPERIKSMQKNWIGKSYGTEINFEVNGQNWPVFTTRPDTIFGVTFVVISAQHQKLFELVTPEQKSAVEAFLKKLKSVSEKELETMGKEGVFTGAYAINPMTKEKIPVYAGNFVVADYGSGMVMAVPTHDQRDYEFAKKYSIPLKQVIAPAFINTEGPDAVKPTVETVERTAVFGIVKHWKEDKYYCLDWEKFNWKTFIIGGVEKGETSEEAVVREVKEETGYQNIKSVTEVGYEVFSKFFATHKGVNRAAYQKTFLVELGSDEFIEPKQEEVKNHKGLWVPKKEMSSFLNLKAQQYVWKSYLKGGEAYTEEGLLINSGEFNGLNNTDAIEKISNFIEKSKLGKKTVNYKLRDWLVSRQRYWGTPIPIVYCAKCGTVPVNEKDLPIKLPYEVKFGEGNPLASNSEFVNTKCPKCGGNAKRETDTMDTFFDSSWYYLRYTDNKNSSLPFDKEKAKYWMPIDQYIGGAEHACMHLIYARFFAKALRDLGFVEFDEPFKKLFNQGMLHGADGNKMSKSLGNIINPLDIIEKHSADSLRFNLMSLSAPNSDSVWSDRGMESAHKFLQRFYSVLLEIKLGSSSKLIESKVNRTVKEVTVDIESFKYNLGIIKLRALFDSIALEKEISKSDFGNVLKLFHPICPHITEELWHARVNNSMLSLESWATFNESKIDDHLEKVEEIVASLRGDILKVKELAKIAKVSKVRFFVAPEWKWTALEIVKNACNNKPDFGIAIKALMSDNEMKKHGAEIQPFLKTAISRLAELGDLHKFDEFSALTEAKPVLEKEFGLIEIIRAEDSTEVKAKNAFPGKPALIIE
ncbi:MAG: class I tRNA ligase family protein [archaeon]|jgi:leucyl-tRNA synthetase